MARSESTTEAGPRSVAARVRELHVQNYKSIKHAVVRFDPLTLLVGGNGTGKSNVLDVLAFAGAAVVDSVELALKSRGGIGAVRRRSGGHPTHVTIRLVIDLPDFAVADYLFTIAARRGERFVVSRERCTVREHLGPTHEFERRDSDFVTPIEGIRAQVAGDRLALFAASATPEFRPVFDFLARIRAYAIVPSALRELQPTDAGDVLRSDGSNGPAVLRRIQQESPDDYGRICTLLAAAVPGMQDVHHKAAAQYETVEFRQRVEGQAHPWSFDALNVSDGTLRLLGLLLAVYQPGPVSVLAVEEPESTVHPAVTEQILEVLQDAARTRQVLVTTHSPDILDLPDVTADSLRVVTNPEGTTVVATVAPETVQTVRDHLFTFGELLRAGELAGDEEDAHHLAGQTTIFGPPMVGAS